MITEVDFFITNAIHITPMIFCDIFYLLLKLHEKAFSSVAQTRAQMDYN